MNNAFSQPSPRLYRRWRRAAMLSLLAAALLAATYALTAHHVAPRLAAAEAENRRLATGLEQSLARLDRIRGRVALADQRVDVLTRANALLRESEAERQAEITRLEADLDFYRRLGGALGERSPLTVQQVARSETGPAGVHRLVFTLTQNLRWSQVASGTVRLRIEGVRDGRPATLGWSTLAGGSPPPAFQFKYFQQVECLVTLPEGFTPLRLIVDLDAEDVDAGPTQTFEWAALAPPEEATLAPPGD